MYAVEWEVERVQVENVEIREARATTEAPSEAIVGREDPVADGVGFATLECSNTVPPNYYIQDVGILPNEAEKSHPVPGRGQESSR